MYPVCSQGHYYLKAKNNQHQTKDDEHQENINDDEHQEDYVDQFEEDDFHFECRQNYKQYQKVHYNNFDDAKTFHDVDNI